MTHHLKQLGYRVNRKRIQRLMRLMGIEAIYPKPKRSAINSEHRIYPYLLRDYEVTAANGSYPIGYQVDFVSTLYITHYLGQPLLSSILTKVSSLLPRHSPIPLKRLAVR